MSLRERRGSIGRLFTKVSLASARRPALVPGMAAILLWSGPADAYVGPGPGITMLAALFAVIMAIIFAIGGLIYWPIRSMRRRLPIGTAEGYCRAQCAPNALAQSSHPR
jgi:hypothetical protein